MVAFGYRLAVDFGTSTTVAVLADPAGRVRPLMFDGSPLLASAVFAPSAVAPSAVDVHAAAHGDAVAGLLVGAEALRAADLAVPGGLEPNPRLRIDDGAVLLGGRSLTVPHLVAAVLGRVMEEAVRVAGERPGDVVLSHPATWERTRIGTLAAAAYLAGLGAVRFVAEPVAAAYAARRSPPRRCVVVVDLGAGTADVSVLCPSPGGFDVPATDNLPGTCGLDRVVALARDLLARTGNTPDGIVVVGGSSRIPQASALLHRELTIPPTVPDRPERAVAEGALLCRPAPVTVVAATADE